MNSNFDCPNKILIGRGHSALLGTKLKELGMKKVLVIYDAGIKAAGIADKLIDNIKQEGIETVLFDKVLADPPDYIVNEAGALGVAENVDGIVGIGGGSSLDTAKGARLLLTNPPPINEYFAPHNIEKTPIDESKLKPLVVIPTTAGTGSEGSPGGIITDTAEHVKVPIHCTVSLAIVDAELTTGLPAMVTASTGFDALCHAVETLTSREPNPIAHILTKEAIRLISHNLPLACKDGSNIEAREAMSLAASLGGISLRGPQGGIPHEIGIYLGARFHMPHGIACGCLLGETMRYIAPVVPDRLRTVAECMDIPIAENASPEEIGEILCEAFNNLYKEVKLPALRDYVKSKEELISEPDKLYHGRSYSPKILTKEGAIEIVCSAFDKL